MKAIFLGLLAFASVLPLQADIFSNSHFTDGAAHWQGDAQPLAVPGDLADPTERPSGVVITLKPNEWTKIYQTFKTSSNHLRYKFTLALSSDYNVPPLVGENPAAPQPLPGLADVPGYPGVADQVTGSAMILAFITQPHMSHSIPIKLDLTKTDSQTFTNTFFGQDFDEGQTSFVIAFPPGSGSVTLTTVSLEPCNP